MEAREAGDIKHALKPFLAESEALATGDFQPNLTKLI